MTRRRDRVPSRRAARGRGDARGRRSRGAALRALPRALGAAALALWTTAATPAAAGGVALEEIATASTPLYLFHAGDDRLFVLERAGRVRIFKPGEGFLPTPFLDIRSKVLTEGERGLYAIAFHPDYANNGTFFVSYFGSSPVSGNIVERYQVSSDPDVADPASGTVVFAVAQPSGQHNAGQIAFGPDGMLYLSIGDGGGSNDQACNAQRPDTLLGKIVRIDVDQNADAPPYHGIPPDNPFVGANDPDDLVLDEIWALGLRNPFRFSFDSLTGDLFIGDVGQDGREEISFQPAGHPGGLNYGWKLMEGTQCKNPAAGSCPVGTPPCFDPAYTPPIFEYPHGEAGVCAVIGGFVYRGSALPELSGKYVFGDFCSGRIWSIEELAPGLWGNRQLLAEEERFLRSFGQDRDGELYALAGDRIFRLVPAASAPSPQSAGQQACINALNRKGADVVRARGRLDSECVRLAASRRLASLGLPEGERTLSGCLAADPRRRVQTRTDVLARQEARRCRVPGRHNLLPDFGFTSSGKIAAAAVGAAGRFTRALLGPDPDAALRFRDQDPAGARCQNALVRTAQLVHNTAWKLGLEGKKRALRGTLGAPAATGEELGALVLGYVTQNRASGRLQSRVDQVARVLGGACAGQALGQVFPGECAAATDAASFAECVRERALCGFCRGFESFDGLALDCDAFDDGAANGSCPSEAELLCSASGTGVNFAAEVDCPRLSDYRLFADPADPRRDANGGIPFDLTTPLFSDYAQKYRFLFLPPGTQATYDPREPFAFPVGTIIAKTFAFAHDLRDLSLGEEIVETRLLIHRSYGWEGLAYIHDTAAGEANLAPSGGTAPVQWIHFDGSPRQTNYRIPSAADCGDCHRRAGVPGDAPIGPKARLLNRDFPYPSGTANQIDHWSALGILAGAPPSAAAPRLPFWNDPTDGTLEERARAYLETNCAHCHNPAGKAGFTGLTLLHDQPLDMSYGICMASGFGGIPTLTFNIVPGDPFASILRARMNSASDGLKMPELAKSVVHEEGVALVDAWIAGLTGGCP